MSDTTLPRTPDLSRFSLEGRTALITGASRNIGAALAIGFALAGADLLLVARDSARLTTHADEVRERTGRMVRTISVDITAAGAAHAIAGAVDALPNGLDILVNNAFTGGSLQAPIVDTPDSVWQEVLETNLMAPVRLCRQFAPVLACSGSGVIINVVSGSGLLPNPDVGAYGVSKAALWMLTRYLAVELAPTIRVNALCPGLTSPDGEAIDHPVYRHLLPLIPLGRLARAEEMVGAAIFLASAASSYATGELLIVNGGRPW